MKFDNVYKMTTEIHFYWSAHSNQRNFVASSTELFGYNMTFHFSKKLGHFTHKWHKNSAKKID